jgi:hypothetical protein
MHIKRSTLRDLVEAADSILSEEKLFVCTYRGVKVEVYADTPAWAKVEAARKMGIRPEVALKGMTAQEVKREVPVEPLTMSHVDRGSPDLTEETVKVHGGDMPDKTFDISTDDGIVKALQMISLVDTSIAATDSWNVSQRERAASKQNEKLWEKLTTLARQRKLKVKYSGIGGDYVTDYAKESVDGPVKDILHENWNEIQNPTIEKVIDYIVRAVRGHENDLDESDIAYAVEDLKKVQRALEAILKTQKKR